MWCIPEFINMNREKHETLLSYIIRVYTSSSMRHTKCLGISDCTPAILAKVNQFIKTYDHTYYFALSGGDRKILREKKREVF